MDDFLEDTYLTGCIDDEEYWFLCDNKSVPEADGPRRKFCLNLFSEEECLKKFRFCLEDTSKLADALLFPETLRLDKQCKATGVESLYILL